MPYNGFLKLGDSISINILKRRIGKTPLIRARNLEEKLGLSKIYLKLEGNNPSGHREDRTAFLIIKNAIAKKKSTICIGTFGVIGGSLAYLSQFFNLNFVFIVHKKDKLLRKKRINQSNVQIIEYGNNYADCVYESRRLSDENDWYDANPGLKCNLMSVYAYSQISMELAEQIDNNETFVFCQTGDGSSISGLHMGFTQLWINEKIDKIPHLFPVSTAHGNAIVSSFQNSQLELIPLSQKDLKESRFNRSVINSECTNGQEALNAVYDSNGKVLGITDDFLRETHKEFKRIEKITLSVNNTFPIAGFIKEARENNLHQANYVIVLNDGRITTDIREIEIDDLDNGFDEFLNLLDEWLIQFSDPFEEIKEAVENAFKYGHVLCAFEQNTILGIAIISRSRFDTFFPKFHLSYIATKRNLKGKGIATQLLQTAIEITKGDISLHVEAENKRAIKLYQKMGFKKKYYRMLHDEDV